ELRRDGTHLYLFGPVPGARQHLAVTAEFGIKAAHLRAARGAVVRAAGFHTHAGVVPVGRDGDAAGADQLRSAAAGVSPQARGSRERRRTRGSRAGRFSAGPLKTPAPTSDPVPAFDR